MASSTPPPNYTLTTSKPYQNHHFHHLKNNQTTTTKPNSRWSSQKVTLNRPPPRRNAATAKPTTTTSAASIPLLPPRSSKPQLSADFSVRRSTRFVSKMHFGRPKFASSSRHSSAAEEVLEQALRFRGDDSGVENLLLNFGSRLCGSDDFTFLFRELGNRGELGLAMRCFEFAILREKRRSELGKLASSMISILGRLGKVELAEKIFKNAVNEGYGNTVYAYSALISAYAKSGYCDEALRVFGVMKDSGLKPNIVTYNALIDACGKGGVGFKRASEIFDDMLKTGVQPDRITFNSLLAVCSGAGLWETARDLFHEMVYRGIDQDIYTYNTLLDTACNSSHIDAAFDIMSEMPTKGIFPNEVTFSTMVRGCAKAGRFEKALSLFNEMKDIGIKLDRVAYNTLVAIYANLGRFDEALSVFQEMETIGFKKDVVTYNALLDGFGKQGMYGKVKDLFQEMKAQNVSPNLLTYSTLISVYSKGGLCLEAMEVYKEFKNRGLKADVVFYSKLIDSLCKKGLLESSVMLLDKMMKEGINPNVVTYNSIINAFGQSTTADYSLHHEQWTGSSELTLASGSAEPSANNEEGDKIVRILAQLLPGKSGADKKGITSGQDLVCILQVLHKMHELGIKPNVVTFSAIINACSRCSSFEEASLLLEELRLFDNQVYGVAHGLLMGLHENVWFQALSLFDEMKGMDSSTASAFYNALTDVLWHFGQKHGAQLVVLEGQRRDVWPHAWSSSCLDLHLMSSGAARAMVHAWLLNIRSIVFEGQELPKLLSILTGWGKHSKVVGEGALKRTVEALLISIGAPFQLAKSNIGRFTSPGAVVTAWLRESCTLKVLVLQDERIHPKSVQTSKLPLLPSTNLGTVPFSNFQALPL
ncbi:hypothetical protein LIER_00066 [Lithospermum erythrorhizon]|uniref:Smr domain-containing protein n=1 Tax=Lithospermum erythrorhizon TaxID=34254 RepID=A0AAV3NG48_LITER